MFLNQELKNLQEAKNQLVICSELRRLLIQIEARGMNLHLGSTLFEQIPDFFA